MTQGTQYQPVMYRPSDNAEFLHRGDGGYSHHECTSDRTYTHGALKKLGFRSYRFTDDEMKYHNSVKIKCQINESPATIVIDSETFDTIFRNCHR